MKSYFNRLPTLKSGDSWRQEIGVASVYLKVAFAKNQQTFGSWQLLTEMHTARQLPVGLIMHSARGNLSLTVYKRDMAAQKLILIVSKNLVTTPSWDS